MVTSIGNPVFETVAGDVSAATVSSDGGKTFQTLAALAEEQNILAANIADAALDASDAKTTVSTLVGKAVTTDQANVANGYAKLDVGGSLTIPGDLLAFGKNSSNSIIQATCANAPNGTPNKIVSWSDGKASYFAFNLPNDTSKKGGLAADGAGQCTLGNASNYFDTAYLGSAVNVVSDAKDKAIVGSFDDPTYEQAQKLSDAVFSVAIKLFQLNVSVADKGEDKARYHVGLIAQEVEAAITAAGLDPSHFAMWTSTPVFHVVEKDSGQKDKDGKAVMVPTSEPVFEADGKTQKMQQMLRYEQVLCTLFAGAKTRIALLTKELSKLTARVAALEVKAGSAS